MTFDEMNADPEFAKLPYSDQVQLRQNLFQKRALSDPAFAKLAPQDQQAIYTQRVEAPPVLESAVPSDFFTKAQGVVARMQQGDQSAVGEAASMAAWRAGSKAMLLPTLVTKGIDAVSDHFDPSKPEDGVYGAYYGRDGDKVGQWLEANVGRYGGQGAVDSMNLGTGAIAGVGNVAEFLLTSLATGGLATGEFAATAAGRALAETPAFVGWGVASKVLPRLAQTAAMTGSMTLMDVGRRVLQDETPTSGEFWNKIATDFGQNVAWDVIGWGIAKGAKTLMTSLIKTGRGFGEATADSLDALGSQDVKDAFNSFAGKQEILKSLSPSYWQDVAQGDANYAVSHIDPKGELGFTVGARSVGYEPRFNGDGSIDFLHATDETQNFTVADRTEGARALGELMTTGQAATFAPEAAVQRVASAQNANNRLVRETTAPVSESMPIEDAAQLIQPQAGFYDAGGTQIFARTWLRNAGVADDVVNSINVVLDDTPGARGDATTIVLPKSARTTDIEQSFNKSLSEQLQLIALNAGTPARDIVARDMTQAAQQALERNPYSLTGVSALADKLGYEMREIGGGRVEVLDSIGASKVYDKAYVAQGALIDDAVTAGLIDDAQLSTLIQQRTGYEVRRVEVPLVQGEEARALATPEAQAQTVVRYTLGKPGDGTFKQIDAGDSIGELMSRHPELDLRLPSAIAPSTWIVDPDARTITVKENFAVGTAAQLLEMSGHFGDTQVAGNTLFSKVGAAIFKDGKSTYRLVNDDLGTVESLGSATDAMKKLRSWNDGFVANRDALAMKGMKMTTLPDGSLAVYDANGIAERFSSLDELQAWQKKRPMPSWIAEMMPIAPDSAAEAQRVAAIATAAAEIEQHPIRSWFRLMHEDVSKFALPTESTFVTVAKRTGNDFLLRRFREMQNGVKLAEAANAKAGSVLHSIFYDTDREERVMMNAVMQRPRDEWSAYAQQVFGRTLTDRAVMRMDKLRSFYDEAFLAAGVDDWKKQVSYLPRIKQFVLDHGDEVLTTDTAESLIKKAFPGGTPVGFSFFGDNLRATDLIHMAMIEDSEAQGISYIYALNKSRYMDNIVRSVKADIDAGGDNLRGYTKSEANFMRDTLMTMQGAPRTPAEAIWRQTSKTLAVGIQAALKKIPGLKHSAIADEAFVGDLFDMANRQISMSTQATPWAMIRNIPQMTLLGAALHNNALVWKCFKEIVEEPASKTINRIVRSGAVQDSLYSHGMQYSADMNLWHRMMKWNENMDIASRATAFSAAEKLLDEHLPRWQKGLTDEARFLKDSQLSILDPTAQAQVMDALKRGDLPNAKFMFGDYLQRLCFFDYSQAAKPLVARGVLGKAFGKFMTWPSSTLALYQRLMSSGSGAERISRCANIVLSSIVVYNTFKAVGIDYQGFLWSDPFGFAGGPIWNVLADGTQVLGTSPSAAMARAHLASMAPKMVSPIFANAQRIAKAMAMLNEGKTYSAGLALSGAPVRRDAGWTETGL